MALNDDIGNAETDIEDETDDGKQGGAGILWLFFAIAAVGLIHGVRQSKQQAETAQTPVNLGQSPATPASAQTGRIIPAYPGFSYGS